MPAAHTQAPVIPIQIQVVKLKRIERIKKIITVVCCILLTAILVQYTGHLVRPLKADKDIKHVQHFLSLPENSVEVLCLGSSHVYWSLDVMEMYRNYGIGAYNYGNDGQHINTTLLYFRDALDTQKPKIALIETFMVTEILEDTEIGWEIYTTTALKNSGYKMEYLKQCFGTDLQRWISYFVPLFGFHENWTDISEYSFLRNFSDADFARTMGYFNIGTDVESVPQLMRKTTKLPLPEESIEVLDEIMKTAEENGVQVVFYTTPFHGWYDYADAMVEYAERNGAPYINMFELYDEVGFDNETDFHDQGHLNALGAIKAANYLGKYLTDHFELCDYREIPDNLWSRAESCQ